MVDSEELTLDLSESERKSRSGLRSCLRDVVIVLFLCGVAIIVLLPNFIRSTPPSYVTACKSNLKNIGTAMEMYQTDFSGKYPTSLSQLTPNYLKTIPPCPQVDLVTYRLSLGKAAPYNTQGREEYFLVECAGENHTPNGVPPDYPKYSGTAGLIER